MTSPKPDRSLGIADAVPPDSPGAREIGFTIPQTYNASRILFDNLAKGRGGRTALTGPLGTRSYAELCAEACRWGHGFISLGLKRGDRILMFLDDTPAYPAAFFGAVRAGFVPLLINTLTPPDLLQFYLADSGASVAVADAEFCARFDAVACKDTALHTLIAVNGDQGMQRGILAGDGIEACAKFGVGDGDAGAGIRQIKLQQVRRRQRVDQQRHESGANRAEERRRIGRRVVQEHQDAVAAFQSERHKTCLLYTS